MKKYIIALTLVSLLLTGCKTSEQVKQERREYVSWIAFCATRGHDINDNTHSTINEYLDTWCGSVEEEEAFIKAGVELD